MLPIRAIAQDFEVSNYRNPEGSVITSLVTGASVGPVGTEFMAGAGVGYAVVTGVVPGVRGLLLLGDGVGGEVTATLTLTPPIESAITPFVVAETGRRFESFSSGWLYGAGGGLCFGENSSTLSIQLGWMFRRIVYSERSVDAGGPIVSIELRF